MAVLVNNDMVFEELNCFCCGRHFNPLCWEDEGAIVSTEKGGPAVCRACVTSIVLQHVKNSRNQEPRRPLGKPPIVNGRPPEGML